MTAAAIPSPNPGPLVFQTDGTQGGHYHVGNYWVNLVTGLIPNAAGQAGLNPAIAATTLAPARRPLPVVAPRRTSLEALTE